MERSPNGRGKDENREWPISEPPFETWVWLWHLVLDVVRGVIMEVAAGCWVGLSASPASHPASHVRLCDSCFSTSPLFLPFFLYKYIDFIKEQLF